MRTSRTAASPTTGAARRTRPRTCSTTCTTAACCAWCGASSGIRIYAVARARAPGPADAAARAGVTSTRWSTSSCASTRRCPVPSLSYLVSRLRYAVPQWHGDLKAALQRAPGAARARARRRRRLVLAGGRARSERTRRPTSCGCWRRSIRWSGTAAASSCSGAGPTGSRPTRRWRSASAATTRCRCSGATA